MPQPNGTFTIVPQGPFSLRESATFGFGQRASQAYDGAMRLAFCVDGYRTQAGVEVREGSDGVLSCLWYGDGDEAAVRRQTMRVLSLDFDAKPYVAVGERDEVIAALLKRAPGLRPPLFYSPYEAAAWTIISARTNRAQAMALRAKIGAVHGTTYDELGPDAVAFPLPDQLLRIDRFAGLPQIKIDRLHAVAHAALEGALDVEQLQRIGPQESLEALQALPGIGPFYSSLIVIRACGFTDVLPVSEPTALALVGRLYGLNAPATPAQLEKIANAWKPFRTWCLVLIRAAAERSSA